MAKPLKTYQLVLDNIFSEKIRKVSLAKLLLNLTSKVYLRGLKKDLGVQINPVKLEPTNSKRCI